MQDGSDTDENHFELRPVLAEILRTCTYPDAIRLRIEHVRRRGVTANELHNSIQADDYRHAQLRDVRLFVSDGKLLMQALLLRKILETSAARFIGAGDFVEVYKFSVKRANRRNGNGSVIYLVIEDCNFLSTHPDAVETSKSDILQSTASAERLGVGFDGPDWKIDGVIEDTEGGFIRDAELHEDEHDQAQLSTTPSQTRSVRPDDERAINDGDVGIVSVEVGTSSTRGERDDLRTDVDNLQRVKIDTIDGKLEPTSNNTRKAVSKRKIRDDSSEDDTPFETASIDTNTTRQRRAELLRLNSANRRVAGPTRETISGYQTQCSNDAAGIPDQEERIKAKYLDQRVEDYTRDNLSGSVSRDIPPLDELQPSHSRVSKAIENAPRQTISDENPDPQLTRVLYASEPPFHTLASLLNPPKGHSPPRKNYKLNTFAVITHVASSLISRPGSSFPPKRHLKIEDPSLYQGKYTNPRTTGVTLAVYRDAVNFKPAVGTIALFRGLIMQTLPSKDIILNVYARSSTTTATTTITRRGSRMDTTASEEESSSNDDWLILSPMLLKQMGFDVDRMQEWWQSRRNMSNKTRM